MNLDAIHDTVHEMARDEMSAYGIDPETKDNLGAGEGNISYVFPLTRTVNFGVNIQF